MTVKELIEKLKAFPDDMVVLVASDDEGNNFRKVPDGYVTLEKFNEDLDIITEEDYDNYDLSDLSDLIEYVVIG